MTTNMASERVLEDLKHVIHDSEELLRDSAGAVGEQAQAVRARLAKTLDTARATCLSLEQKTIACAKATDKVIRDHPYQSIGIAFGIGLLLGVITTRD